MAVVLCPKCQGQKHVQTPPWVAGDMLGYSASDTRLYTCPVCAGAGVLDTEAASGAAERERLVQENARLVRENEALREIVMPIAYGRVIEHGNAFAPMLFHVGVDWGELRMLARAIVDAADTTDA